MGVNIGWIFGSVAAFAIIWSYLFFPELKGRSLEEVDELFAANLWAWQFEKHDTHGSGALITALENEGTFTNQDLKDMRKGQVEEVELAHTS